MARVALLISVIVTSHIITIGSSEENLETQNTKLIRVPNNPKAVTPLLTTLSQGLYDKIEKAKNVSDSSKNITETGINEREKETGKNEKKNINTDESEGFKNDSTKSENNKDTNNNNNSKENENINLKIESEGSKLIKKIFLENGKVKSEAAVTNSSEKLNLEDDPKTVENETQIVHEHNKSDHNINKRNEANDLENEHLGINNGTKNVSETVQKSNNNESTTLSNMNEDIKNSKEQLNAFYNRTQLILEMSKKVAESFIEEFGNIYSDQEIEDINKNELFTIPSCFKENIPYLLSCQNPMLYKMERTGLMGARGEMGDGHLRMGDFPQYRINTKAFFVRAFNKFVLRKKDKDETKTLLDTSLQRDVAFHVLEDVTCSDINDNMCSEGTKILQIHASDVIGKFDKNLIFRNVYSGAMFVKGSSGGKNSFKWINGSSIVAYDDDLRWHKKKHIFDGNQPCLVWRNSQLVNIGAKSHVDAICTN